VIGDNVIIEKAVVAPSVTIGDGVSITSKTPANEITLVSENLQQNNFVYHVI
jgi:UDP-3-O-[3-hydroxymyristoyl] glucosamine N-acyltransferase